MRTPFFNSQIFWWGLYYGLSSIGLFLLLYAYQPELVVGLTFSIVAYILLPAIFMIVGGLAERKTRPEGMDYRAAYTSNLLVGIIGLMVSTAANPLIMAAAPEMQETIMQITKEKTLQRLEAGGLPEEQVDKIMARFDEQASKPQQLKGMLIALVFGLIWFSIMALLTAMAVRNVKKGANELTV